jgi:hypothetical protein
MREPSDQELARLLLWLYAVVIVVSIILLVLRYAP